MVLYRDDMLPTVTPNDPLVSTINTRFLTLLHAFVEEAMAEISKAFDEGRFEDCKVGASHLLQSFDIGPIATLMAFLFMIRASNDWTFCEHYVGRAMSLWNDTRRYNPIGNNPEIDGLLDEIKGHIDEIVAFQAVHKP